MFRGASKVPVTLETNGREIKIDVEPRRTLLSVLRDELGLAGSKEGCGEGNNGAGAVMLPGETVCACMTLAIDC